MITFFYPKHLNMPCQTQEKKNKKFNNKKFSTPKICKQSVGIFVLVPIKIGLKLVYFETQDMENVLSGGSAARVKFQTWGKILALNIRCFFVNGLSVAILRCF